MEILKVRLFTLGSMQNKMAPWQQQTAVCHDAQIGKGVCAFTPGPQGAIHPLRQ